MKFTKTEVGQKAFKERSPLFSARQRSAFILFDGQKTADQVLTATAGMGVTRADVDYMVEQGFLAPVAGQVPASVPGPVVASADAVELAEASASPAQPVSDRTPQERYSDAKPIATKLTAGLGLRGFMLNLSVESAAGYEDLLALLPKIQDAVGTKACRELERALKG
ncbi:hypothetical protein [Rhodoferax mekongensis]|uniref:Uncharacterized protein n=1 Tax=Rhodoferax mekongensis TaxID=3068341 RepID=A0ABZ0AZ03_9BURK|nr:MULTISPECIES: hypothetical protein [unclassified Rhodoferax]MDT7514356.1 hypothetical protein [Rhodoferax sp. TBRC 17199]WNO04826.1 hypothetical protein RAN89_18350 [Rhodoferax sp. TBRC 17307]